MFFQLKQNTRRGERGFTLLELLIVIAIIGILAAISLASLSTSRVKGQYARAQSELVQIRNAMELLFADTGLYPHGVDGGLDTLCPSSGSIPGSNEEDLSTAHAQLVADGQGWSGWNGPYIQDLVDPWGTPYYFDTDYECTENTLGCDGTSDDVSAIVSCGPDGMDGGSGGSCLYGNGDGGGYTVEDNVIFAICRN